MESKKINQLATELAPDLSDLTIIGDPTTGISKKITLSQMASLFTGTVEEYANFAAFPLVGVADTIYIALDTNILYRWNTGTSAYVELSPNIVSSLVFNDANGFDGTINLVGSVATLTITTALTTGSVGFIGASGALLQDNANFFWDDTNNRLGLGTNAPTTALDVFGSGIIGRINGTSTNNAFLGFASAGTNKWSIGNVQSDHRFRIYNEATTSELVSVLSTGEFGIGIANPLTKLHIDGGATALIANLDADVSVAKSVSFRSDNSNRINLEVSGTESGSNAGANFFIRRYSDAGALIDTPLTITRSTGAISLANALSGTSASFGGALSVTGNNFFTLNATNTNARIGEYDAANRIAFTANQTAANAQDDATKPSWGLVFNANSTDTFFIGHKIAGGGSAALSALMTMTGTGVTTFTNTIDIALDVTNSISGLNLVNNKGSGYGNSLNYYTSTTKFGSIQVESSATNTSEMSFKTMVSSTLATRLFISSAGFVGIGTTSPSELLDVNGITRFRSTIYLADGTAAAPSMRFFNANIGMYLISGSDTIGFSTGNLERMRIGQSGQIGINSGNTSARLNLTFGGAGQNAISLLDGDNTVNATFIDFKNSSGTIIGYIGRAGGTNAVVYSTTSDYRLKEDLKDFNGLEKVSAIKVYDFNWIGTNERTNGVIAHELAEILPFAVTGQKDKIDEEGNIVYQGVDYSKIVPSLIKAIQELKAEIDLLKAK